MVIEAMTTSHYPVYCYKSLMSMPMEMFTLSLKLLRSS